MAILLLSVPPIAVSKQTGLTSTSFSLRFFRGCSLLNLLPQLEGFCSSQQAGILKLQAHFLSAAVFTSHPCAFALTYCWNDDGSDVFSSATLLVWVFFFFLSLIFLASEMDGSGKGRACWETDGREERFPRKGRQSYWATSRAPPCARQELHLP